MELNAAIATLEAATASVVSALRQTDLSSLSRDELVTIVEAAQRSSNSMGGVQTVAVAHLAAIDDDLDQHGAWVEQHRGLGHMCLDAPGLVASPLGITEQAASTRVEIAVHQVAVTPQLVDEMLDGDLDSWRARVVTSEIEPCPDDGARAIADDVIKLYAQRGRGWHETGGPLRSRVRRMVARAHPDVVEAEAEAARVWRSVYRSPATLGTDHWEAELPVEVSLPMWQAVEELAAQLRRANPELTVGQARADALAQLVLQQATVTVHLHGTVPAGAIAEGAVAGGVGAGGAGVGGAEPEGAVAGGVVVGGAEPEGAVVGGAAVAGSAVVGGATVGGAAVAGSAVSEDLRSAGVPPADSPASGPGSGAALRPGQAPVISDRATPQPAVVESGPAVSSGAQRQDAVTSPADPPDEERPHLANRRHEVGASSGFGETSSVDHSAPHPPGSAASALSQLTEVGGLGSVTPTLLSLDLLARGPGVRIVDSTALSCHPDTGAVVGGPVPESMSRLVRKDAARRSDGYVVPADMARLVRLRDGRCRFPNCMIPASRTDQDHVIPWPVGETTPTNLMCLCRRHHRVKQRRGWRVRLLPNGVVHWSDPAGRLRVTYPIDHLDCVAFAPAREPHSVMVPAPTLSPALILRPASTSRPAPALSPASTSRPAPALSPASISRPAFIRHWFAVLELSAIPSMLDDYLRRTLELADRHPPDPELVFDDSECAAPVRAVVRTFDDP